MANKTTAATSWRWRLLLLLLVAVAALCWIPPAIAAAAAAAAASSANGARRSLLGFVEAQGNASYQCTPSGPCIPCQYSEKVGRFSLLLWLMERILSGFRMGKKSILFGDTGRLC